MTRPLVALVPGSKLVVFESIDRPELGVMGPEDVELCEDCGHLSGEQYRRAMDAHGHHCLTCRGFRLVSGYAWDGRGYPVALVEGRGGGAVTALRGTGEQAANNRHLSPPSLPPAA